MAVLVGSNYDCINFGTHLANPGNVDGTDGRDDLLVGANGCFNRRGKAFLFSSSSGGLINPVFSWDYVPFELEGRTSVVAGIGDFNSDGKPDFSVSTPGNTGRVDVFYGSASVPSEIPAMTMSSGLLGTGFGEAVAGGVDVNFDGFDDLVIAEPRYTSNGLNSRGRISVYFGGFSPSTTSKRNIEGTCAACRFGTSLGLGLLNSDDYGDFAGSQPGFGTAPTHEGEVRVHFGEW